MTSNHPNPPAIHRKPLPATSPVDAPSPIDSIPPIPPYPGREHQGPPVPKGNTSEVEAGDWASPTLPAENCPQHSPPPVPGTAPGPNAEEYISVADRSLEQDAVPVLPPPRGRPPLARPPPALQPPQPLHPGHPAPLRPQADQPQPHSQVPPEQLRSYQPAQVQQPSYPHQPHQFPHQQHQVRSHPPNSDAAVRAPHPLGSHPVPAAPIAVPEQHGGQVKLSKGKVEKRRRSNSFQPAPKPNSSFPPQALRARGTSPAEPRGRSASAQPPRVRTSTSGTRIASATMEQPRPASRESKQSQSPPGGESRSRGRLRRSWRPSGGSRSNSQETAQVQNLQAWVLSSDNPGEYKTHLLARAEKVPELWNESASVYVYLFPRGSGCGPSFKVPEFAIADSLVFRDLTFVEMSPISARNRARSFGGRDSLMADDARAKRFSPPSPPPLGSGQPEQHLYLPAPPQSKQQLTTPAQPPHMDVERLIAVRNLFAFLTGQPLVATVANSTMFSVFLQIATLLSEFGFTNADGSSFGKAAELSFGFFMEQMALADVRHSREKTLEALILGERMRSLDLYNEAFAHAVGKYSAILDLRSSLFEQVTLYTRQRLERAHLDLIKRLDNVNTQLERFEFPSLFAGVANSTSDPSLRPIRFKLWAKAFERMKSFVLGYYKSTFGNWPPKASSKKNPFSESGLNRLVLKVLYSDLCALYDLLVDRTALTPRVIDEAPKDAAKDDTPIISALRKMLSEFDHCSPPVLPPVPFDVPLLPTVTSIMDAQPGDLSSRDQAKLEGKKLKEHDAARLLQGAYNADTFGISVPFLRDFREFELKEAKGRPVPDVADQRIGHWLFLYVVIQSLPMLVVDAPGLKHTEAVEYFLCEPPMGHPPWMEDGGQVRKMWYEIAGGSGYVELSADAVMFSVEAIYHRSHCWLAARRWEGGQGPAAPPPADATLSPLEPPRPMFPDAEPVLPPSRPSGPSPPSGSPPLGPRGRVSSSNRSSIALGLEPVAPPFSTRSEAVSSPDSNYNSPVDHYHHASHQRPVSMAFRMGPPPPHAHGHGNSHMRSSSLGPRPMTAGQVPRNMSSGNLIASSKDSVRTTDSDSPSTTSGATFDDILAMQPQKMKKKSRFFGA